MHLKPIGVNLCLCLLWSCEYATRLVLFDCLTPISKFGTPHNRKVGVEDLVLELFPFSSHGPSVTAMESLAIESYLLVLTYWWCRSMPKSWITSWAASKASFDVSLLDCTFSRLSETTYLHELACNSTLEIDQLHVVDGECESCGEWSWRVCFWSEKKKNPID